MSHIALGGAILGASLWLAPLIVHAAPPPLERSGSVPSLQKAPPDQQNNRTENEQRSGESNNDPTKPVPSFVAKPIAPPLDLASQKQDNDPRDSGQSGWQEWALRFVDFNLADAIVAVFTGLLWWLTTHQLKATEIAASAAKDATEAALEANRISRQIFLVDQRPWVCHAEVSNSRIIDPERKRVIGYILSVRWINAGKTPAVNCLVWGRAVRFWR